MVLAAEGAVSMDTVNGKIIETCAEAAHEANRVYCKALGDTSHVPWDDAPDWQRESCREGVRGVLAGATPEQSHENWLKRKLAEGWRYGPVKNAEIKEHPCVAFYRDLPRAQRVKDEIFVSVARAVAHALNIAMYSPEAP